MLLASHYQPPSRSALDFQRGGRSWRPGQRGCWSSCCLRSFGSRCSDRDTMRPVSDLLWVVFRFKLEKQLDASDQHDRVACVFDLDFAAEAASCKHFRVAEWRLCCEQDRLSSMQFCWRRNKHHIDISNAKTVKRSSGNVKRGNSLPRVMIDNHVAPCLIQTSSIGSRPRWMILHIMLVLRWVGRVGAG
jgi:hypothetical protein